MAKINLDAARAARREAEQEAPIVTLGGKDYELPVELPFEVAEHFAALAIAKERKDEAAMAAGVIQVVKSLLGDHFDSFMKSRPSIDDLLALVEGLTEAYGVEDVGESQASAV